MEKLDKQIILYDDNGKEFKCEMLFTYEHEERDAKYVFFYEPDNEDEIFCMRFDDDGNLFEIEDDEELKEMDEVLQAYLEDPQIKELKKQLD